MGECYGLKYIPQNSYVEALTPIVTVFGDRPFKETTGWDCNPIGLLSFEEEREQALFCPLSPHTGDHMRAQQEGSHHKPSRQASPEPSPDTALDLRRPASRTERESGV